MRQNLDRDFNWLLANATDREIVDEVKSHRFFVLKFMQPVVHFTDSSSVVVVVHIIQCWFSLVQSESMV